MAAAEDVHRGRNRRTLSVTLMTSSAQLPQHQPPPRIRKRALSESGCTHSRGSACAHYTNNSSKLQIDMDNQIEARKGLSDYHACAWCYKPRACCSGPEGGFNLVVQIYLQFGRVVGVMFWTGNCQPRQYRYLFSYQIK